MKTNAPFILFFSDHSSSEAGIDAPAGSAPTSSIHVSSAITVTGHRPAFRFLGRTHQVLVPAASCAQGFMGISAGERGGGTNKRFGLGTVGEKVQNVARNRVRVCIVGSVTTTG